MGMDGQSPSAARRENAPRGGSAPLPCRRRGSQIVGMAAQPLAGPGEINHGFVDPYSLVHGLVGVATAALGLGLWSTLALAVSWEVAEHLLKNLIPTAFPHPTQDTLANSAGDILATLVGWAMTRAAQNARARTSRSGA